MNTSQNVLRNLDNLNAAQLRRLLTEHLTKQKLGLYWESDAIDRDRALNAHVVLPRLVTEYSYGIQTEHSTAQHSTAQHSTAQHSTAQHSTAQHSTAQHSTAQRFA
jgi:hypothetical protein